MKMYRLLSEKKSEAKGALFSIHETGEHKTNEFLTNGIPMPTNNNIEKIISFGDASY